MTSISKIVYIDKLDDIVNEYNTYRKAIKMKTIDVEWSTYIEFGVKNNDKDPKFEVGDQVKTPKYKKFFAKGCTRNSSEEVFAIKNFQKLCCRHI